MTSDTSEELRNWNYGSAHHHVILFYMKRSRTQWVVDLTAAQYGFYGEPAQLYRDFKIAVGTSDDEFVRLENGFSFQNPLSDSSDVPLPLRDVIDLGFECSNAVNRGLLDFHVENEYLNELILVNQATWCRAEAAIIAYIEDRIEMHLSYLHEMSDILERDEQGWSFFKIRYIQNEQGQAVFDESSIEKDDEDQVFEGRRGIRYECGDESDGEWDFQDMIASLSPTGGMFVIT